MAKRKGRAGTKRSEAEKHLAAVSEVLRSLSNLEAGDPQPILDAVAERAARLFGAVHSSLFLAQGNVLHRAAMWGSRDAATEVPIRRTLVNGRAYLERRAIHVSDIVPLLDSEYPDTRENQRQAGFRSLLSVPLIREGQPIGTVSVWRREVRPFSPQEIRLLEAFADQAVIAIENARLFNETKEALEHQRASAEILRVVASSVESTNPAFEAITRAAVQLVAGSRVGLMLVKDGHIHYVAHSGVTNEQRAAVAKFFPMPLDDAGMVTSTAILEKRILHMPDIEEAGAEFARAREISRVSGWRAMLSVPLIHRDVVIGAINVQRAQPGAFSEKQIELVKTFADQAVIAIQNTRLFNETKEALERQTATADILKVISGSPTDVQPVFDAIVRSAVRLVGGHSGIVTRLLDDKVHLAAFTSTSELVDDAVKSMYPIAIAERPAIAEAVRGKSPVLVTDTETDPRFSAGSRELARARGYRSLLHVPLLREGTPIGLISVTRVVPGRWSDHHVELVKTFADQAVIAIENVRLFNETKEALERQTATADILKVISSSPTDLQPVFDAVAERAARICGATQAGVFLASGDELHRMAFCGSIAAAVHIPIKKTLVNGRAFLERRTIHVEDIVAVLDEYPDARENQRRQGFRTLLSVPLLHKGQPIGTINAFRVEVRPFSEQEINLLQTFADQAVIAIENVRLFKELEVRNKDLTVALDRQTATAEILRAISSSHTSAQTVFEAIADSALRLLGAWSVAVTRYDGQVLHLEAARGAAPGSEQYLRERYPIPADTDTAQGRCIHDRMPSQIADCWSASSESLRERSRVRGYRSVLAVPMMRGKEVIGVIAVSRREAGTFASEEIDLLRTFGDQAVIAIENVRLFNETKEALEQQKASGDVLGAISSSIADTKPVFDKILESCQRLFEGYLVGVNLVEADGQVHLRAYKGERREEMMRIYPLPLTRESGTGAAILEQKVMHFPDVEDAAARPAVRRGAGILGFKSIVFAPMLFEGRGIGAIWVAREFAGAFTDKQIALLKTFADQAVIAIQNARLFREIQEKSAQLEVANKHKSDFLANMSHELRTPLNAIIGFSEVLMDKMFGEVNEKQLDYLKDIHESGRHLLSLINDILDLSKIEAGRMELEISRFSLPTVITNAMTLIRERAHRHGIHLGQEIDPRLGEFEADERKVKQILLNLLSNAVKFTPDGGRVDVSAKLDTDRVAIAVRDTGVGITPQDQAALFEEFKQIGKDSVRKAEGTGLGLALTRRFARLHGGDITIESEPGRGSTFTVTLPIVKIEAVPAATGSVRA